MAERRRCIEGFRAGGAGDFRHEFAEKFPTTVFLRMMKRDPSAERVENIASFLHRAAVNAALDLMRSRQSGRSIPLDELEPVLADSAHRAPDRAHAAGEIREIVPSIVAGFLLLAALWYFVFRAKAWNKRKEPPRD